MYDHRRNAGLCTLAEQQAPDLQILNDYHCVVFADGRCDFVKVVPADICDTGMPSLHFEFLLLPVVAEFYPAA